MIARRQFVQRCTSALAVAALPAVSRALSLPHLPTLESHEEKLPTAIEGAFTREQIFKVVGVGGYGCNVAMQMMASGLLQVEYVFADSHCEVAGQYGGQRYIRFNRSVLKYYGCLRDRLRETEETVVAGIRSALEGTDMLFITAGLGGCTGTNLAPIISLIAKEMGIATVGFVTLPMEYEGECRSRIADAGLSDLQANVDSLKVRPRDSMLELLGDDVTEAELSDYWMEEIKSSICFIL